MQNEWNLGVIAACLAYNTTVHSSTGQTPFFATFGREAKVPVHWIYPTPKPDREMELSGPDGNYSREISTSILRDAGATTEDDKKKCSILQAYNVKFRSRELGLDI